MSSSSPPVTRSNLRSMNASKVRTYIERALKGLDEKMGHSLMKYKKRSAKKDRERARRTQAISCLSCSTSSSSSSVSTSTCASTSTCTSASASSTSPILPLMKATSGHGVVGVKQIEKEMDGAPEGDLYEVQVIEEQQQLTPLPVPILQGKLARRLEQWTRQTDRKWNEEYELILLIREYTYYAPEEVRRIWTLCVKTVLPATGNLRSALSRHALYALNELLSVGEGVEMDGEVFDEIIYILLSKSVHLKKFLRPAAKRGLITLIRIFGSKSNTVQSILKCGATDKNANIVDICALSCRQCLEKIQTETVSIVDNDYGVHRNNNNENKEPNKENEKDNGVINDQTTGPLRSAFNQNQIQDLLVGFGYIATSKSVGGKKETRNCISLLTAEWGEQWIKQTITEHEKLSSIEKIDILKCCVPLKRATTRQMAKGGTAEENNNLPHSKNKSTLRRRLFQNKSHRPLSDINQSDISEPHLSESSIVTNVRVA